MRTMRERAEAAGGRIDLFSAPGKGTSVVASVHIS
jgi:signal transduction histidine kinase